MPPMNEPIGPPIEPPRIAPIVAPTVDTPSCIQSVCIRLPLPSCQPIAAPPIAPSVLMNVPPGIIEPTIESANEPAVPPQNDAVFSGAIAEPQSTAFGFQPLLASWWTTFDATVIVADISAHFAAL